MKKILVAGFHALLVLALSACSSVMIKSPDQRINPSPEAEAQIVFMRSSFTAGALGVELFEIENGELRFIGQLPNGSKVAHRTKPGRKVYMAYGNAADFMIADVLAGKTYYSIVRPNWGTGGFAPTPVRTDGTSEYNTTRKAFKEWLADTDLLVSKPDAKEFFEENKAKYQSIYNDYWQRFQRKSPEQIAERTMRPIDGI